MAKTATLSRQHFIDAALQVVAEVGVDKLSMRRVATELGVSPMAMYKHFPNKEELLAATLDAVIASADVFPDDSLAWQAWIEQVARGMYQALCSETSWVPLLGSMRLGSQAAVVTAAFIERLSREGFSQGQAANAYIAVIQVVIGGVCLHSSINAEQQHQANSKLTPMTLSDLDEGERQRAAPMLDAMGELDQLGIGLPMILTALEQQLRSNSAM